ncbi:hypothetical protein N9N28_03100 [Rubripirellula amarantea]|nr:hypothetical protein [Rubripirellula amarantea]
MAHFAKLTQSEFSPHEAVMILTTGKLYHDVDSRRFDIAEYGEPAPGLLRRKWIIEVESNRDSDHGENPMREPFSSPINPYQATNEASLESPFENEIDGKTAIREMGRWQFFIVVLFGIGLVLMLAFMVIQVFAIGGGSFVEILSGVGCFGVFGLVFYGIPAYLLLRASQASQNFAAESNRGGFAEFARRQMLVWRVMGILVVLGVISYGLFIAIALFGMAI